VTVMGPDVPTVPPAGTVAVMSWSSTTENRPVGTFRPSMKTAVAPVKLVPTIDTLVPWGPELGVKLVMPGPMVKLAAEVPGPKGVITVTGPVPAAAPVGIVAEIWFGESIVKLLVGMVAPAMVRPVVLFRKDPPMVTLMPTAPVVGVKDDTVGNGVCGLTWASWKSSGEPIMLARTNCCPAARSTLAQAS